MSYSDLSNCLGQRLVRAEGHRHFPGGFTAPQKEKEKLERKLWRLTRGEFEEEDSIRPGNGSCGRSPTPLLAPVLIAITWRVSPRVGSSLEAAREGASRTISSWSPTMWSEKRGFHRGSSAVVQCDLGVLARHNVRVRRWSIARGASAAGVYLPDPRGGPAQAIPHTLVELQGRRLVLVGDPMEGAPAPRARYRTFLSLKLVAVLFLLWDKLPGVGRDLFLPARGRPVSARDLRCW